MKKCNRLCGAIEIFCCAPQHARIMEYRLWHRVPSAPNGIENDIRLAVLPPGEALHRCRVSRVAVGQHFLARRRTYSVAARECFRRSRCGNHGALLLKAEDADLTAVVGEIGSSVPSTIIIGGVRLSCEQVELSGVGRSAPKIAILAGGLGDSVANVIANWPPLE